MGFSFRQLFVSPIYMGAEGDWRKNHSRQHENYRQQAQRLVRYIIIAGNYLMLGSDNPVVGNFGAWHDRGRPHSRQ